MQGFWDESKWYIDGKHLVLPSGYKITLVSIKQELSDRIMGNHDLGGKWSGWRVRQQFLIPPGGSMRQGNIFEHVMRHIVRSHSLETLNLKRRQLVLF